jgi:MFS family permease
MNFSRATTSVATGISRLEGGLEAPLTGWLVDKFGPRWVIFVGIATFSAIILCLLRPPKAPAHIGDIRQFL